jgi:hypothetical protein
MADMKEFVVILNSGRTLTIKAEKMLWPHEGNVVSLLDVKAEYPPFAEFNMKDVSAVIQKSNLVADVSNR